jgi:hypothetical protein
MRKTSLVILFVALLPFGLMAQEKDNHVKKLAAECGQAMVSGDYGRVVDLTYPKLVELSGGKDRMIESMEKGRKEMTAEGYDLLSATVQKVMDIVKIGSEQFVVITYEIKMKAPNGYLLRDSYMLGIASTNDENWTFLDGAGLDESKLKIFFPGAVGKIALPPRKQPVFYKQ